MAIPVWILNHNTVGHNNKTKTFQYSPVGEILAPLHILQCPEIKEPASSSNPSVLTLILLWLVEANSYCLVHFEGVWGFSQYNVVECSPMLSLAWRWDLYSSERGVISGPSSFSGFGPGCHFSRSEYTSRGELRQSWVAKNRLEVWKYLCFQYYDWKNCSNSVFMLS